MRYGEFLKEGGTIGLVAPSLGCTTEPYKTRYEAAKKRFQSMGYQICEGPNCNRADGIGISAPPKECGDEINEMYCDSDSDVIISVGGGEMMCEVVPYIDFEKIATAKPKWYQGYSDNTNFVFNSVVHADTAAIYGPCVGDFATESWHESLKDCYDLICGNNLTVHNYDLWEINQIKDAERPLVGYNVTEPMKIKSFPGKEASFSGRLIGGCLDCLVTLAGTRYGQIDGFLEKYKEDGFIWFIEACDLNIFSIRRAIWELKECGWFKYVKGFLVGRPRIYGEEYMGLNQYTAVTDLLSELNVPIIMDLDIGHLPPMMPIICGAMADVTVKGNAFTMTYRLE